MRKRHKKRLAKTEDLLKQISWEHKWRTIEAIECLDLDDEAKLKVFLSWIVGKKMVLPPGVILHY